MRNILIPLFILSFVFVYGQIPPNGLIASYNFDNNTNDDLYGNYNGTLLGGATITNGRLNCGYNDVDAFSIPGTIFTNTTEFSMAFDVNFNAFNVNHASAANCIFSGASSSNDNLMNFVYTKDQLPGGSATLQNVVYYLYNGVRYEFNNISLLAGTDYHFALVRGVTTVQLYINGVEQAPIGGINVPTFNLSLDPNGLIFAQDQDVLAGGFQDFQSLNGSIDNLIIYDRGLSNAEVLQIYNGSHSLSIAENDETNKFSLYPNPTQDIIYVDGLSKEDNLSNVKVYSISGKLCQSISVSRNGIDISQLEAGTYFIQIEHTSGIDTHTVVKY